MKKLKLERYELWKYLTLIVLYFYLILPFLSNNYASYLLSSTLCIAVSGVIGFYLSKLLQKNENYVLLGFIIPLGLSVWVLTQGVGNYVDENTIILSCVCQGIGGTYSGRKCLYPSSIAELFRLVVFVVIVIAVYNFLPKVLTYLLIRIIDP